MDQEIKKEMLDNPDFYELLLKHMYRDPATLKRAVELGTTPDDFMSSNEYGIMLYKELADIAISVGSAPIDLNLVLAFIEQKMDAGRISQVQIEQISDFLSWVYQGDITPNYFEDSLRPFILRRRGEKIKKEHIDDTDALREELNLLAADLTTQEDTHSLVILNPFDTLVMPSKQDLIPTGFRRLDEKIYGVAYGDYNLLTGFTGSGKTAAATVMAEFQATLFNKKVAYLAMEDTKEAMATRFYARNYEMDYSLLRKGDLNLKLQDEFSNDNSPRKQLLINNLRIFSLKGMTPMTCDRMYAILVKYYDDYGWYPDVVFGDQMQFLTTNSAYKKFEQPWQEQEKLSSECDELSHKTIGGHPFTLWMLHQLKGKPKIKLNREDLQGFKGIDQKADLHLAIGRENERSPKFCFQSIKTRHSAPFELPYAGELQYMRFADVITETADTGNQISTAGSLLKTLKKPKSENVNRTVQHI